MHLLRHLRVASLVLLASFAVAAVGCGEKESGIGAGQKPEASSPKKPEPAPSESSAQPSGGSAAPSPQEIAGRPAPKIAKPTAPAPNQLRVRDLTKGTGAVVQAGDTLAVNYKGVVYSSGKEFDSSFTTGQPFQFQLGTGMVIPGWDRGLVGARVGARRELTIPASLAYGDRGSGADIKPGDTLIFVIDVIAKQ